MTTKYVLDLLKETRMLGCQLIDIAIEQNHKFGDVKEVVVDRGIYQILVEKLIYLFHTRLDIAYVMSSVSQFMHSLRESHFEAIYRIL